MTRATLITIAFSHFNEKARWALDWCGIDYKEKRYMPGFSHLAVLAATWGRGGASDKVSSRYSTPVFLAPGGERLCDSTEIALWASRSIAKEAGGDGPLFPNQAVVDRVADLGVHLGPHTRRVAYFHLLDNKLAMGNLAPRNVGALQALAFRALLPGGKRVIKRGLGVSAEKAARSLERVREQLDRADKELERSPYLMGNTFTAADLTFAALLAPSLLVTPEEGYGGVFPRQEELSPAAQELIAEVRASRAGKFALEVYRKHRHERPLNV